MSRLPNSLQLSVPRIRPRVLLLPTGASFRQARLRVLRVVGLSSAGLGGRSARSAGTKPWLGISTLPASLISNPDRFRGEEQLRSEGGKGPSRRRAAIELLARRAFARTGASGLRGVQCKEPTLSGDRSYNNQTL
eukprot:1193182-Prorocentrum_minimum.AAC.1